MRGTKTDVYRLYKYEKENVVPLPISPQETKMTQKLTTIGHRTAFNNDQSSNRIVSYKRP